MFQASKKYSETGQIEGQAVAIHCRSSRLIKLFIAGWKWNLGFSAKEHFRISCLAKQVRAKFR